MFGHLHSAILSTGHARGCLINEQLKDIASAWTLGLVKNVDGLEERSASRPANVSGRVGVSNSWRVGLSTVTMVRLQVGAREDERLGSRIVHSGVELRNSGRCISILRVVSVITIQ